MKKETIQARKIAISAVFAAMAFLLLLLSSVLPTMQLAVIAFAGLLSAAVLIEAGIAESVMVWVVVSLLGFLLLPDKSSAVFYLLYFGHYPIVKYLIEELKKPWLQWVLKMAVCHACLALIYWIISLFFPAWNYGYAWYILWAMCVAVFILYDLAMTKLIILYQQRIRPKFNHKP